MAYYDRIARSWHRATGRHGGAFKRMVLNERLLGLITGVTGRSILELGAGNGYLLPMILRRFSGQAPRRIVISDGSSALLAIARHEFSVPGAEYLQLDARSRFPFDDASFDLVLAVMLLNELSTAGAHRTLTECRRVLSPRGRLILGVTHPDFVRSLERRGMLRSVGRVQTMPGSEGLRLPVVRRSRRQYESLLTDTGWRFDSEDVFPSNHVVGAKPGLKKAGKVPLALLFNCRLPSDTSGVG